jgi:hypothetical protein
MNFNPANTLSYYSSTPQTRLFDVSHINTRNFAINCKRYYDDVEFGNGDQAHPDRDALEFYALNHLSSLVRSKFTMHEQLPDWAQQVMAAYQNCLRAQGQRMLNYMMLITTRESRHTQKKDDLYSWAILNEKFGVEVSDFARAINDSTPGQKGAVTHFHENAPDAPLGAYCDHMVYSFFQGGFNGGYGGKPWGKIAETLTSFIKGKTSLEMMVDTAWTLAHNNGPMFNKGMLYHMYTNDIYKILDVQRSGQIPELVLSGKVNVMWCVGVKALVEKVVGLFPNEFGTEVDWYKVEALGSLKKYPQEKNQQKVVPPPAPAAPKMVNGKKVIGEFKVFPGQTVSIIERKVSKATV